MHSNALWHVVSCIPAICASSLLWERWGGWHRSWRRPPRGWTVRGSSRGSTWRCTSVAGLTTPGGCWCTGPSIAGRPQTSGSWSPPPSQTASKCYWDAAPANKCMMISQYNSSNNDENSSKNNLLSRNPIKWMFWGNVSQGLCYVMQWGWRVYGSAQISVTKVHSLTLLALRGGWWEWKCAEKKALRNTEDFAH